MTVRLDPCATCSRHVKASDAVCPFCGAPMVHVPSPPRELFGRMARAAAVAAGVTALGACDVGTITPLYGAYFSDPEFDAAKPSGDDAAGGFIPDDGSSAITFYGSPGIGPVELPDGAVDGKDAGRTAPDGAVADAGLDGAADDGPDSATDGGSAGQGEAGSDGSPDSG